MGNHRETLPYATVALRPLTFLHISRVYFSRYKFSVLGVVSMIEFCDKQGTKNRKCQKFHF